MSTFYTGYCLGRALTAPNVTCTYIGLHSLYRYVQSLPCGISCFIQNNNTCVIIK